MICCWVYSTGLFGQKEVKPPEGFSYIHNEIPDIVYDIRYAYGNNFIGTPIDGYKNTVAILSTPALMALSKVQKELANKGFGLKIFDGYRPQKAVDHFVRWAKNAPDTLMKQYYYPYIPKSQLFNLGYIASKSGHTRGSTVDLTIIDKYTGREIDMGSPYDFFGNISHHSYPNITSKQKSNRQLLKNTMEKYGFRAYKNEWWHYTLNGEPYPNHYFDFDVE